MTQRTVESDDLEDVGDVVRDRHGVDDDVESLPGSRHLTGISGYEQVVGAQPTSIVGFPRRSTDHRSDRPEGNTELDREVSETTKADDGDPTAGPDAKCPQGLPYRHTSTQ